MKKTPILSQSSMDTTNPSVDLVLDKMYLVALFSCEILLEDPDKSAPYYHHHRFYISNHQEKYHKT